MLWPRDRRYLKLEKLLHSPTKSGPAMKVKFKLPSVLHLVALS